MHLFYVPRFSIQNRNAHIPVLNEALWDMEQMYFGVCKLGQLLLEWLSFLKYKLFRVNLSVFEFSIEKTRLHLSALYR